MTTSKELIYLTHYPFFKNMLWILKY